MDSSQSVQLVSTSDTLIEGKTKKDVHFESAKKQASARLRPN